MTNRPSHQILPVVVALLLSLLEVGIRCQMHFNAFLVKHSFEYDEVMAVHILETVKVCACCIIKRLSVLFFCHIWCFSYVQFLPLVKRKKKIDKIVPFLCSSCYCTVGQKSI